MASFHTLAKVKAKVGGHFMTVKGQTIVVLLILLITSPLFAANICVGPSAAGNGSGSDWNNRAQWSSVTLLRGNTHYLAAGTYGAKSLNTADSGSTFIYIKKATESAHGPATGWNSSYAAVATFTGSLTISTDYWDFDGVTGGGPGSWKTGFGIAFSSTAGTSIVYFNISGPRSYLQFHHVQFTQTGDTTAYDVLSSAFYATTSLSNSLIEYCYGDNLGGTIWLLRDGSNNIIQYNYSGNVCGASVHNYNNHCEALVMWDMNQLDFRYNYIAECPSSGGVVRNAHGVGVGNSTGVRIYGNVFETGFPIQCNSAPCTDWRIFNNTFHHITGGPVGGDGTRTGLLYYNNIVFKPSAFSYVGAYSWFSQATGGQCSSGADSTSNVTLRMPINCDLYPETTDPFVNSSGHLPENFLLKASITAWPGINACNLDSCDGTKKYNYDAFGNLRGKDGVWSRGAYEYGGTGLSAPRNVRIAN